MPGPFLTQTCVGVDAGVAVPGGVAVNVGVDVSVGGFGVSVEAGVLVGVVWGIEQPAITRTATIKSKYFRRIRLDLIPK